MKSRGWISVALVGLIIVLSVLALEASGTEVDMLMEQLLIQKKLVAGLMGRLDRAEGRLEEAWTRVQRTGADFYHATDQGDDLNSLSLRDEDIRAAESELMMGVHETQQIRRSLLDSIALLEELEGELKRLGGEQRREPDPLSGRWSVTIEPGDLEGEMILVLDGTLVQGRYELDGGFRGSLRGTLVSNRVRLERIDSQLGFAAIYYGRLNRRTDPPRLEGKWEATQLATGMPAGGSWVAEKIENDAD